MCYYTVVYAYIHIHTILNYTVLYTLELAGQDGDAYEGATAGKKTSAGGATSNISKTSKSRSEGKESRK